MVDSQETVRSRSRKRTGSRKGKGRRSKSKKPSETSSAPERDNVIPGYKNAHFQRVTKFSQWCPPTRESETTPDWLQANVRPTEEAWYERQRLMTYYPEALIADASTVHTLQQEIQDLCAPGELPLACTSSLIATGEISDLSNPADDVGHPVLAVAGGQLGDGLRLVSLSKQKWAWTEQAEVGVVLNAPGSLFDRWLPESKDTVSCLRFALDIKGPYPIRWIVVQKASCTTIYEPVLQPKVDGAQTSPPGLYLGSLATIQPRQTGGASQCDFTFRPIPGGIPQLAIIDESCNWSLWDLQVREGGDGLARSLKPVLRVHGKLHLGTVPRCPAKMGGFNRTPQFLVLSAKRYKKASRNRSQSENELEAPNVAAADNDTPASLLLMFDGASLYQKDLRMDTPPTLVKSVNRDGSTILDIAKSDSDPSEAFILTKKDLLWISAKEDERGGVTLYLLKSCPHQRRVEIHEREIWPALKLEVSPAAAMNASKGCYVCIRSSQDTEVTIFWLAHSGVDGAQIRCESLVLRAPFRPIGMAMLPAGRVNQEGDKSGLAAELEKSKARFFQFLLLTPDLEVSSALCVWSEDKGLRVPPPSVQVNADEEALRATRAEYLPEFGHGFDARLPSPDNMEEVKPIKKLKIPFTFSKGGQWHGLDREDIEMEDDQVLAELQEKFKALPRGGITEESTNSMIEAVAAQVRHENIEKSALPQRELDTAVGGLESQSQMTISSSYPLRMKSGPFTQDPYFSQVQSSQLFVASSQPVPPSSQSQLFVASSQPFPASSQSQLFVSQRTLPAPSLQTLLSASSRRKKPRRDRRVETDEEPALDYLRKYPIRIDPLVEFDSTIYFGPMEWQIGGNEEDIDWTPNMETLDESYDRAAKRRKKIRAKQRLEAKMASWKDATATGITQTENTTAGESSPGDEHVSSSMAAVPASQPAGGSDSMVVSTQPNTTTSGLISGTQPPVVSRNNKNNMFMSNQMDNMAAPSSSMGPIFSSQVGSSQMVSSQILGGLFGGRKPLKKGNAKPRSGFR